MSFPRYPEYKDSGVESLGQVPSHWSVGPIKRFYRLVGGTTPRSDVEAYWNGSIVWVTPADLSKLKGFEISDSERNITEEGFNSCGTNIVPIGSIVLSTRAPIGTLGIAAVPLCTNQGCKCLIPNSTQNSRFLTYVLSVSTQALNVRGRGTTFLELSADELGSFKLPFPNLVEQSAIANFLEHETAKIDALVAEQERLIELLKEKRQAVISHTVTKGLDPTVKMRDSGFEWLGDVPSHWTICSIKRFTDLITDGAHVSPETEDGIYDFVSTKDLIDGIIDFDGALKTSADSYEYLQKTGCQPLRGDVLFSKDGTIGRTVIVTVEQPFVVASSLIIIRPSKDKLDSEFLNYLCQSNRVQQQVDRFVKGAGLPRLSIQNLLRVYGTFPSIDEQIEIVQTIRKEVELLECLVKEANKIILILQERRSTLISAAVTGRIDVRNIALESEAV